MWKSYLESNSNFVVASNSNFAGPSSSRAIVPNQNRKTRNSDDGKSGGNFSNGSPTVEADFQFSDNLVSPCTPVLFSTSRGLQLRTRRTWRTFGADNDCRDNYCVQFCDLERWNTNRAHVLSISEDNEHMLADTDTNRTRSVRFGLERGSSNLSTTGNH